MATSRLRHVLRTKGTNGTEGHEKPYGKLSNEDLTPTPPSQRNWSPMYFFAFQFSIAFSPTTYNIGSSLFAVGLNWWTIIIAAFVGTGLCCGVLYLNSRGPSWYHVGFPVYVRATAGIYGSMWFIFIRMIVAVFYEGTQTYYASRLLGVALRAVFGKGWENIPNHLPEAAGITTSQMLAFFLTWLIQLPSAWIHPSKVGPLFVVKSVLSPIAYFVTMIWAVTAFKGVELDLGSKTTTGGDLGWSFMKAINTVVSGVIPPMVNIADLARYGNRPKDVNPLIAGLFISKPVVILVGLFTTAAGAKRFGVANWNLWDFYSLVLDNYWSPSTRALIFLGAFIQALATICTNISSNAIPIGCDLAGLFPSYFTIVRGQIMCNLLIWAVVPWLLVNSAKNFITFLDSYLCFISPILGCMIVDYWLVRRGNMHIPSLYRLELSSPYYYTMGFNLRAFVAWASGVVLVISGIAGAISPGSVSDTAVNLYNCGFILSFTAGAVVYYGLCKVFPPKIYPDGVHEHETNTWESLVPTEGFFYDDVTMPEYIRERVVIGETSSPGLEPNASIAKKA
ncbi:putative allantoin permease [Pseudomassariella vexata]|uniref:Putative allantoin permease n=1 Tax=Pseudomassariella vexata TaxID=1141098 RepID=A0A1Y2E8P9_9PEZI|nr:putative allantoin permease [Pseudomassariella vexata]ORY67235.1 putative allantoin permease [Pseudomassariella vexata]